MAARAFWLLKTEPGEFSFDDLWKATGRRAAWDGVRNYQARNFLRDAMHAGDGVLVYHSSAEPTGIAGVAEIASPARPDPTQFDHRHAGFDPKSRREEPSWWTVDVRARARAKRFVTLDDLRASPALAAMGVLRRGNRLSVQPVTPAEWAAVLALAGLDRAL